MPTNCKPNYLPVHDKSPIFRKRRKKPYDLSKKSNIQDKNLITLCVADKVIRFEYGVRSNY